jgi:osmotically-inducible protein OsmY
MPREPRPDNTRRDRSRGEPDAPTDRADARRNSGPSAARMRMDDEGPVPVTLPPQISGEQKKAQRKDNAIRDRVLQLLEACEVDARGIEIAVHDGEVALAGHVPDRAKTVREVSGVHECHSRLRVRPHA